MKYDVKDNLKKTEGITSKLIIGDLNKFRNPFFSIVIPTYKRTDLLKQCVLSAINQKNIDFDYEIIVVDNDDSDSKEVETILNSIATDKLYYYKNSKNLGGAGNWNRCVTLARSSYVIMCHDDDWLKEECLATMKDIVCSHDMNKIGYIRSSAESYFDVNLSVERSLRKQPVIRKKKSALIKFSNFDVILTGGATWAGAPTCGTLINKRIFLEVGGYNNELTPCFDCYVPYQMLKKNYEVDKTYYSLGYYRWSDNDTYNKTTLLGLIKEYNEFLCVLSNNNRFVRIFSNENYFDCVKYYRSKAKEAYIEISDEEINEIRIIKYSRFKLKILYFLRKTYNFKKQVFAN